jgi:two-component system, chemotaxis family, sensor kinase CheA
MSDDILREFLIESRDNLDQLDRELVALEKDPRNRAGLASIFRTVHTIKGTAGFFQFAKLEMVTHAGENLLSRLRDGEVLLETVRTTALLAMVDATRRLLSNIEASETEGDGHYGALIEVLTLVCSDATLAEAAPLLDQLVTTKIAPARPAAESSEVHVTPKVPDDNHTATATTDLEHRPPVEAPAAVIAPLVPAAPVAPPPVEAAPEARHADNHASDTRIRVDVRLLDRLMNLVGELVLGRNQLLQYASTSADASLVSSCQRLNLITTELQEGVMKTRMQPIENVWNKFPRIVRDLSHHCGKEVRLEMEGSATELDKTIIENISDPLTHLVRNAVDHGIETPQKRVAAGKHACGTLRLRAFHEGGRVNIEIVDDGGGIDPERIKAKAIERGILTPDRARTMPQHEVFGLLFLAGFSTAEAVTNISGRGVGLDVVKNNIERMGGSVDIDSRAGHGTTFRIRIPLTLAIIPALVVGEREERFAIPQVNLVELVRLEAEQARTTIERIHGVPVFRLRGNLLALVELSRVLDLEVDETPHDVNIVVLQADERQFGLLVDTIHDTEEIVVKPLGRELKGLNVYAGATIMGDGRVALILDVAGLAERAGVAMSERRIALDANRDRSESSGESSEQLLLFRAGKSSRMALPLRAVARLEEFSCDRVERVGGDHVVQYRGEILPLVYLADLFGEERGDGETLQVVVHTSQGRNVGFVVDAIEDIIEQEFRTTRRGGRTGVVGSAVIQGRVIELLDAEAVRGLAGEA